MGLILKNRFIRYRLKYGQQRCEKHMEMMEMKMNTVALASMIAVTMLLCGSFIAVYANGNDLEAPDNGNGGFKMFQGPRCPPWIQDLTDDQREVIHQLIEEMREAGSNPQEIKDAVDTQLGEWGIEIPEAQNLPPPPWMGDLTDDQKQQIQKLVETMREDGASREEINEAVLQQLEEWGIDTSNMQTNWTGEDHREPRGAHLLDQLTEEQRDQLQQKIQELRDSGTSREQIRDMVHAQLEEWGIDIPENESQ